MKQLSILFLIFICFSCKKSQDEFGEVDTLSTNIYDAQKQIVGSLTGKNEIVKTVLLNARATTQERALTRHYLKSIINQLSLKPIEHRYKQPNQNPLIDILIGPFKGVNIYTELSSTNSNNDYVVLGAHYDTARDCPGANDNASAMALIYAVAKKLSQLPTRNKNVILVFFDQEEEDLIGSKAFSKYVKSKGINIHSVHTFDQVGWDEDADKAIELELPTKALEDLYKTKGLELNIPIHTTRVNSTDHQSFRELGYNAVGITEEYVNKDTSPFKDTEKDTYETVNFTYLKSSTELVYEVIKNIITE